MSKLNKRLTEVFGTVPLDSAEAARSVVQRPTPQMQQGPLVNELPKEIGPTIDSDIKDVNINVNVDVNSAGHAEVAVLKVGKAERYDALRKMKGFWIENEIVKAVDSLAKKGGKGFASDFANEALREHLKRYGINIAKR